MELLFWACVGFVAYTFLVYPLAIWLLSRVVRDDNNALPIEQWPEVTVVIAAHNEESRIQRKLEALLAQDYPKGKLRIVVVSDGSTDSTEASVREFPEIDLLRYARRRGKPHALNLAMTRVHTPVIILSDTRQRVDPYAVRTLVARLLQPGIGVASGELVHVRPATETAAQIGLYWRYEKWIRLAESRWHSTVGTTGAFYAIRREDWVTLAEDTILDDFEQPMWVARSGRRIVIEPKVAIYDELQTELRGERQRKIRTLTGNFQSFLRHPWLFSPATNPLCWQFVSHKVFRLFVPYALIAILISSGALAGLSTFYAVAAILQVGFYMVASAALVWPRFRSSRMASFAAVFVELNWATVVALHRYLTSRIDARWEKTA